MNMYTKVSIIFPNYNGGNEPLDCLDSISKLNYPKNKIEIIVVDNNSTDGSLEKIKKEKLKKKNYNLKIIENKKNLGFAKAINQGIKKSTGEYIFIGNDDIIFGKKSIKYLVDYMDKNSNTGVIGGKIFLKNNPKKIVSCGYVLNHWTGNIYTAPHLDHIKNPDWIQGCAMLTRKKIIEKIGMLDEKFSFYFEDYDFCLRAKKAGCKIIYLPNAHFWHGQSTTANKNKPLKYYFWYKNKIRFTLKNLPLINIVSILLFQIIIIVLYQLIILRDGRFIPFIKGLLWNIKHITETLSERNTN